MSSAEDRLVSVHSRLGKESAARGVLGAWLFVAVHVLVLVVLQHARLSGVWEVQSGVIGLLPAWLLLAVVPGALGGIFAQWCVELSRGRGSRRWHTGALFFGFGALVAWGVGGGRHLASYSMRSGFAVCVGTLCAAAAFWLVPRLARFVFSRGGSVGRAVGAIGAATAVCLALEITNQLVLVRLYTAFHLGLSGLAFFVAGWGWGTWSMRWQGQGGGPRSLTLLTLSGIILCGALLVPASRFVRGFDNFRWIVSEASPSLRWGLELASHVAPPPELDTSLASLPLGQRRSQGAVDLRGRDILLISIDALRADHLGAYGYERPTSPAMDSVAETGVLFEAAYAPTPHTSYSVVSLMTGKYMRPLLLQGAGTDSDLWAELLRAYEYRTAAFYPPAVFFIDTDRFRRFQDANLGFEYAKVEFAEGDLRVSQFEGYLEGVNPDRRVFAWVHLFGPHEPYEGHDEYDFGKRDIDLYDSEIRAADETVGRLVKVARTRNPDAVVILTADHGEEFGDHGGRYHGSSVFDEQVRVPLIIDVPGVTSGGRVQQPVQTVDLLPTVLSGLSIPIPPRIRGRDLTELLSSAEPGAAPGRAVSETDDHTLLAEGVYRLICGRRTGACRLYDISTDPAQTKDLSRDEPGILASMREKARSLAETHGKYESQGLRAEGKGWPAPILRGISGEADVAPNLALLLDDADRTIRTKAAELLFDLATTGQAPALRLALTREEDSDARAWIALTLTRLGQGAPLVFELLSGPDLRYRRYAALALAEAGHDDGEDELIRWWAAREGIDHELALRILRAFATIRSKEALGILIGSLGDVRLRPHLAETLGRIGDKDARPHLAAQLVEERYRTARLPLARAIVKLGGDDELIVPLRRFLGVPERLEGGLGLAVEAGILDDVGGPKSSERRRLEQLSDSGIRLSVVVPPGPKSSSVRLILRARSKSGRGGEVLVEPGRAQVISKDGEVRSRNQPQIRGDTALRIPVPGWERDERPGHAAPPFVEVAATLPQRFGAQPGHYLGLEIFAPQDIEITALAAVPERADLPPPPPEPWEKPKGGPQSARDSSESKEVHSP